MAKLRRSIKKKMKKNTGLKRKFKLEIHLKNRNQCPIPDFV